MTNEELAAIKERAARTPNSVWLAGPWVALADIPALVAEVERLRGLVEAAYREGAVDANPHAALARNWQDSKARRALGLAGKEGKILSVSTDATGTPQQVAMAGFVGYIAHEYPAALPHGQKSARFYLVPVDGAP